MRGFRHGSTRVAIAVGVVALVAASCSDADPDDAAEDTTVDTEALVDDIVATTSVPADTTTTTEAPAPTTTALLVTEGATVVVANASIVGGSAGRMTDQLAGVGFTTGTPTNAVDKLVDSVVHFTDADGAETGAESVAAQLGGVEVSAMPDPIPVEEADIGDANVLVLLGDNQADQSLDELQGVVPESAVTIETSGLTVVVANAAGVDGAAGLMSDELEAAGVTVGTPTNAVVQLADSIVHHTETEGAEADAQAIADALGGVEVQPLPDEIPTEASTLDGDVLVLVGTNQATQTLAELNP